MLNYLTWLIKRVQRGSLSHLFDWRMQKPVSLWVAFRVQILTLTREFLLWRCCQKEVKTNEISQAIQEASRRVTLRGRKTDIKGWIKGTDARQKPSGYKIHLCITAIDTVGHKGYCSGDFSHYLLKSSHEGKNGRAPAAWEERRGRVVTNLHRPH